MTPTRRQVRRWLTPERAVEFWSNFQKASSGCLEWTGAKNREYGVFYPVLDGKQRMVRVHRAVYVLEHGDITETDKVRHFTCDNPICGNIKHLRLGTTADNNGDKMGTKYNGKGGDKHPNYRSHVRHLKPESKWNEDSGAVLAEAGERMARNTAVWEQYVRSQEIVI